MSEPIHPQTTKNKGAAPPNFNMDLKESHAQQQLTQESLDNNYTDNFYDKNKSKLTINKWNNHDLLSKEAIENILMSTHKLQSIT